jgi:hypothetical protein
VVGILSGASAGEIQNYSCTHTVAVTVNSAVSDLRQFQSILLFERISFEIIGTGSAGRFLLSLDFHHGG